VKVGGGKPEKGVSISPEIREKRGTTRRKKRKV